MSNIDLKRLAEDREYWDRVAPENARWYIRPKPNNLKHEAFFAVDCDSDRAQLGGLYAGTSTKGETYSCLDEYWHEPIPRPPQKAQEAESLGGWRTGDIVQTGPNSLRYKVEWAKGEDVLISEIGRPYEINLTKWDMIIPVRTKEQRLRDELAERLKQFTGQQDMRLIADTLIDEGWIKDAQ